MPFQPQGSVTRNPHIRDIEITLHRTIDEDDHDFPEGIEFRITIDDQWGHPMGHRSGDLVPHLAAAQKTALKNFMDAMWTKAQAEVIEAQAMMMAAAEVFDMLDDEDEEED